MAGLPAPLPASRGLVGLGWWERSWHGRLLLAAVHLLRRLCRADASNRLVVGRTVFETLREVWWRNLRSVRWLDLDTHGALDGHQRHDQRA